jgi:DNA-binding CsgD family transcriptional regulator
MNKSIKKIFFKHSDQSMDESKYKELEHIEKMCDAVSKTNNQSVYLVDYLRQNFLHISPHPLFLCGYEVEEAMKMGLSFTKKILPPEDLQMLAEIYRMTWQFIYKIPLKDRAHFYISYDIHFRHKNGNKILVNQKTAPFLFTDEGNIWISMCVASYSSKKEAGNVVFARKDKNEYYNYDFEQKQFIPYQPETLSKREEEIMRLSMQGYNEISIAERLNISVRTVKNHRYNAERKLGVNNMANAVSVFNSIF